MAENLKEIAAIANKRNSGEKDVTGSLVTNFSMRKEIAIIIKAVTGTS